MTFIIIYNFFAGKWEIIEFLLYRGEGSRDQFGLQNITMFVFWIKYLQEI